MRGILLAIALCISSSTYSQDTLLKQQLDEVEIHLNLEKEVSFEDNKHFILDFHIGDRGNFLLLKQRNKYFTYMLNDRFEVEDSIQLDFKPKELFHDCLGFLHIVGRDSIYELGRIDDKLLILERNPIHLYNSFLKGCLANNSTQLIFKRLENFNQTTAYYGISKANGGLNDIYLIEDPLLIRSAKDTHDTLALDAPGETATMTEVGGYDLEQTSHYDFIHNHIESKAFFDLVVTTPGYHPIFVKKDTTYIFDYLNDKVVVMNDTGYVYRVNPIQDCDKQKIELDKKQDRFYAVEEENGAQVIGLLSPDNFKVIRKTKIEKHAYPRKVIIYNGYAYYIYKEFMNDNLNKLFRQRI